MTYLRIIMSVLADDPLSTVFIAGTLAIGAFLLIGSLA